MIVHRLTVEVFSSYLACGLHDDAIRVLTRRGDEIALYSAAQVYSFHCYFKRYVVNIWALLEEEGYARVPSHILKTGVLPLFWKVAMSVFRFSASSQFVACMICLFSSKEVLKISASKFMNV